MAFRENHNKKEFVPLTQQVTSKVIGIRGMQLTLNPNSVFVYYSFELLIGFEPMTHRVSDRSYYPTALTN